MTTRKRSRQTLLIEFGYRGAAFHGLYPQPGMRTAGGTLRDLVERQLGWSVSGLAFSARTDAGVDALRNFATLWFRVDTPLDPNALARQLQSSDELWVHRIESVPRSMHARNCARTKHYRYVLQPGSALGTNQFTAREDSTRVWMIAPALDDASMNEAAQSFVGTHDFRAFRAAGCSAKTTLKTLNRVVVTRRRDLVVIDVEGNAFLRKMVRIMVGTLAEVGAGLRPVGDVARLLDGGERKHAGLTAPAHGLTLVSVELDRPNPKQ